MYDSVNVVIVTYGDRWQYLQPIIASLEEESIVGVIFVVDNASSYSVFDACAKCEFKKVDVHRKLENIGSAGGFSLGISLASKRCDSLVLLLDDDNLPRPGTVQGVVDTYNDLARKLPEDKLLVLSYRGCQHANLLKKRKKRFCEGEGFLGFNIFNAFQRRFFRDAIEIEPPAHSTDFFLTGNRGVAYGGMLFSEKLVDNVGYPKAEMILYYDDYEYTSRMLSSGCYLFLDNENEIDDIQENHSVSFFKKTLVGFLSGENESKIYYLIRNKVCLDEHTFMKRSFPYFINKYTFFSLVSLLCLFTLKFRRLRTIRDAFNDGRLNILGLHKDYQLQ